MGSHSSSPADAGLFVEEPKLDDAFIETCDRQDAIAIDDPG